MLLNRTSKFKVMTIWISRGLPLFNYERLDISCAWIGPPCEKFWRFEFLESSCCSISSVLICDAPESHIRVNIMTISVFREFPLFNFEQLYIVGAWIGPPCEKLWPFEFLESFHFSILRISILSAWIGHPTEKLWPFEFLESFRSSISSVSICDAPELDILVKSY